MNLLSVPSEQVVSFVVMQIPKGKARHRTVPILRCGRCQRQTQGHHDKCPHCGNNNLYFVINKPFMDTDQGQYERFASLCATQAMQGKPKFVGPTKVECKFWFSIPKSREKKLKDGSWHCQRPDTDNLVKSIWDSACCGICTADDCIIAQMIAEKRWTSGIPRTEVTISSLEAKNGLELESIPTTLRPQPRVPAV
jgi:Holliday junction resolvase RusA-like endonuclease